MSPEQIHATGLWAMRILLVAGAITLSFHGKYDAAGTCGGLAALSFFLLG
jgi:hypothetical protein